MLRKKVCCNVGLGSEPDFATCPAPRPFYPWKRTSLFSAVTTRCWICNVVRKQHRDCSAAFGHSYIPSLPLSSQYLFGQIAAGQARQPSVLSGVGEKIGRSAAGLRAGAVIFDIYMNRTKHNH